MLLYLLTKQRKNENMHINKPINWEGVLIEHMITKFLCVET